PTRVGEAPRIGIEPNYSGLTTRNRAVTAATGNATFWISRQMGTNELTFRGNVPTRGTAAATVTIHDPPLTFGEIFADRLKQRGIRVDTVERAGGEDAFEEVQV